MKKLFGCCAVVMIAGVLWFGPMSGAEEPQPEYTAEHMKEMMAKAKKIVEPGKHHKALERFIGEWDTETRFIMGGQASPPEKGSSTVDWLMEGRWLKSESKGTMMGRPVHSFMIMGYDNFKMSYVTSMVSTFDTAMLHSEGDMTRDGDVLITYGTLDEYLTGEHDKMVKYVWRFVSDDKIVMEVHDLPIGEENTKVIEVISTRRKQANRNGGMGRKAARASDPLQDGRHTERRPEAPAKEQSMREEQKPPIGTIMWRDLTVPDAAKVRDFYKTVVGWESAGVDMGGYDDFNMMPPGTKEPVAGICHPRGSNASLPPQWLLYITVDDADRAAERCKQSGGKVLDGPRNMGSGRFCVIQDPAGAVVALYSP